MEQTTQLQKNIMRRVYYVFGIRLATHPVTLHLVVLVAAVYALTSLVFVERVVENIATTQLADLGGKMLLILARADTLSLFVFAIAVVAMLSLPVRSMRYFTLRTT